jgi:hypothetical protein
LGLQGGYVAGSVGLYGRSSGRPLSLIRDCGLLFEAANKGGKDEDCDRCEVEENLQVLLDNAPRDWCPIGKLGL